MSENISSKIVELLSKRPILIGILGWFFIGLGIIWINVVPKEFLLLGKATEIKWFGFIFLYFGAFLAICDICNAIWLLVTGLFKINKLEMNASRVITRNIARLNPFTKDIILSQIKKGAEVAIYNTNNWIDQGLVKEYEIHAIFNEINNSELARAEFVLNGMCITIDEMLWDFLKKKDISTYAS